MRVSLADPPLYLLDPRDVEHGALPDCARAHHAALLRVLRWAHAYLCQPHPDLGREGPVCPFTQPALERGTFWLATCPGRHPAVGAVRQTVARYGEWFQALEPTAEKDAQYRAILLLFPEMEPAGAPAVVDAVQAALKPVFVARGLMIGQFHHRCAEPALWNAAFRPLRSPVPLLAIRPMVRTDAAFLLKDPAWLSAYLARFGDEVPARLEPLVRQAARALGVPWNEDPHAPARRPARGGAAAGG